MSDLTRQQLCASLAISESKVKELEKAGMPAIASPWSRRKTYNLVACTTWLRANMPGWKAANLPISARSYYSSNERAKMLKRAVPWADKTAIKAIYLEAQRLMNASGIPHHVDHIIPLQGELVSGLHVHTNLQILTGSENSKKRNRFEVEP